MQQFYHHLLFDHYQYLYQGAAQISYFSSEKADLPQKVESTLYDSKELSTVKVVEWAEDIPWKAHESDHLNFLLSKYGRFQGSQEHTYFIVHNYTDISLQGTWSFHEGLEPLTIDYDGGISLRGFAQGQGVEQMSTRQVFELRRDRPLWTAMRWQTVPDLEVDYSISMRLYNREGERAYQEDAVLRRGSGHPTSYWWMKDSVEFLTVLTVPDDLPAGEYELRLVVYDLETLIPTVEIGVWEPETTLARLRLAENP